MPHFDPHPVSSLSQITPGRMRRVIGPVVLAHVPDLVRVPLAAGLSSTTAITTAVEAA